MRIIDSTDTRILERLLARDQAGDPRVVLESRRIVEDVRARGDRAVIAWARRLGDPTLPLEIPRRRWVDAAGATSRPVRAAIRMARRHIERIARAQRARPFSIPVREGVRIEQRIVAFDRVGCYVPGGRHPLPSTLLMTVVPAVVAGVREVVVVCPDPVPAVLYAALEAGATRVFRIGGAQAIAALAYGTRSVPRADKIVGPGNAWVAAAKSLVAADCAVDLHAGPSEIVWLSDDGRPDWIAADLLAQAEHDPAARAILVTRSRKLAREVVAQMRQTMPASGPARTAIRRHGAAIITRSRSESLRIVNRIAPEHLVCEDRRDALEIRTAGTIFVGRWSAQAAGDYTTGSNHVLPTGGTARVRGGLSPADFVRTFTVQTLTRQGLRAIGPSAVALADAEGLSAHSRSIRIRL